MKHIVNSFHMLMMSMAIVLFLGIARSSQADEKRDFLYIGDGGSLPNGIKFLKEGTIAALVVQDPFRMGYEGVKTGLAASKGEKVEAVIDTGVTLITKENMEDARSQELLNPKLK